jgi:hypothetical protein
MRSHSTITAGRVSALAAMLALIMSQFVHAAVLEAEESHHVQHHELGLDLSPVADGTPKNDSTHLVHDLFHCGGHYAALWVLQTIISALPPYPRSVDVSVIRRGLGNENLYGGFFRRHNLFCGHLDLGTRICPSNVRPPKRPFGQPPGGSFKPAPIQIPVYNWRSRISPDRVSLMAWIMAITRSVSSIVMKGAANDKRVSHLPKVIKRSPA